MQKELFSSKVDGGGESSANAAAAAFGLGGGSGGGAGGPQTKSKWMKAFKGIKKEPEPNAR